MGADYSGLCLFWRGGRRGLQRVGGEPRFRGKDEDKGGVGG